MVAYGPTFCISIKLEINAAPIKPASEMDRSEKKLKATVALIRAEAQKIRIERRNFRVEIRQRRKDFDAKYKALLNSQMRTEAQMRKTDEKLDRLLELLR
jgi:hypothetical protein